MQRYAERSTRRTRTFGHEDRQQSRTRLDSGNSGAMDVDQFSTSESQTLIFTGGDDETSDNDSDMDVESLYGDPIINPSTGHPSSEDCPDSDLDSMYTDAKD